jgi:hypothetical protein
LFFRGSVLIWINNSFIWHFDNFFGLHHGLTLIRIELGHVLIVHSP